MSCRVSDWNLGLFDFTVPYPLRSFVYSLAPRPLLRQSLRCFTTPAILKVLTVYLLYKSTQLMDRGWLSVLFILFLSFNFYHLPSLMVWKLSRDIVQILTLQHTRLCEHWWIKLYCPQLSALNYLVNRLHCTGSCKLIAHKLMQGAQGEGWGWSCGDSFIMGVTGTTAAVPQPKTVLQNSRPVWCFLEHTYFWAVTWSSANIPIV